MLLKTFLILVAVSLFTYQNAFSETYELLIDGNLFTVNYEGMTEVIAMEVDKESKSLLVGIQNTEDANFEISFPDELISAESNEFAILVNGYEVDYDLEKTAEKTSLAFFVPYGSQEIEIIGTRVIPEFPFGTAFTLGFVTLTAILLSKTKLMIKL